MGGFTAKPMRNVMMPSKRKSQNHPGLPATPRIFKMPAASREDMTRAICMHRLSETMLILGQEDLTLRVDQKKASRKASSLDL